MRKAVIISFTILAVALIAALAALWPLAALAGPPAQISAPARIQSIAFANSPSSGDYAAGEHIRITVTFDQNVTVAGQPKIAINIGRQQRRATYYQGSGSTSLTFSYTVQASDWDGNGVSVPAGSIALSGGGITDGNNLAVSRTHSGIADDASRKVKGSADTNPSFGSAAISAQTYPKGTAITDLILPAATGGNGLLAYSLHPAPPVGLAFNAVTRTLAGTPSTTQNSTTYTYSASDGDEDTVSLTFTITVDGTPSFPGTSSPLPAQTYATGTAIALLTFPAASDGNTPLTYSLSPAPPDGLVFNAASRTLSGTPTAAQNAVTYTYTVTDADGDTDSRTLNITVDGAPSFPANAVSAQTYAKGAAITSLALPAAADGNTPLTYSLSPALPDGLVFNSATRTISGAPTLGQAATTYTYTVTDADGDTAAKSFTITVTGDYDLDDDGLIEIDRLTQLDAVRWDLNGDGTVDTGTSVADSAKYSAAFPSAVAGMGCLRDHDDDAATDKIAGCIGYELTKDLDFDTDGDGATYTVSSAGVVTGDAGDAYYNGGKGWKPIGTVDELGFLHVWNLFTATFDGDGKTISNLFIKNTGTYGHGLGLFVGTRTSGRIERLGLRNLNVTGIAAVAGLVGYSEGTISASYATGSITGTNSVGGLVGRNNGIINASYATGSVSGNSEVGGLIGYNEGIISTSYATSSVSGRFSAGGLVGYLSQYGGRGTIRNSYATGSVTGTTNVGGLVGRIHNGTIANSYWDTGTTGQATSAGGTGKTTSELQSPTGYTGIYANWNANLDGIAGNDDPWDFGTNSQYPTLKYGGLIPGKQRPVTISVQSVNGNIPIVGGPVTAAIDTTRATGITWQWQSSADGSTWNDIANATGATYIPVAADAASGGKYLRVKASFTVWGESHTATSDRTAKVVSNTTAPAIAAASAPIVGAKLRYYLSAAGATHRTAWQWRRCDDAAMTSNCVLRAQSNSASDAYTEYTPVAGSDTDVGKYLQAYAYYAANDAGKTWMRAESPVLGPVVAAPATTPSLTP